jgi:hypothetical protein
MPIQWVPEALSVGVKWLECEADHSLPTSVDFKKMWVYTSTPPYVFIKHRDNFNKSWKVFTDFHETTQYFRECQ